MGVIIMKDFGPFYVSLRRDKSCFKYSVLHVDLSLIYFHYLIKHTDLSVSYIRRPGYSFAILIILKTNNLIS
jgi:hypothetical protein